jgi:hypothetical protein
MDGLRWARFAAFARSIRARVVILHVAAPFLLCWGLACGGGGSGAGVDAAGGVGGISIGGGGAAGFDAGPLDAGPMLAAGQFTIVYDSMYTSTVTTCRQCTAWYNETYNYGTTSLQMENSGGPPHMTRFSIQLTRGFRADWELGLTWLEDNPTFPQRYQGTYDFEVGLTAMQVTPDSCITLTSTVLGQGGNVAGSLNDCAFFGGMSQNQGPATISGSFTAKFDGVEVFARAGGDGAR